MILAAGLSPAWQQIADLPTLRSGEVNRANAVHWCASGKVLNVGIALANLIEPDSVPVGILSVIGGATGASIRERIDRFGVQARWVESEQPTRICTTLLDRSTGQTTEIVENARPLSARDREAFRLAFREELSRTTIAVLSGSLPEGTPSGFYRELITGANIPIVLDARGEELNQCLGESPFLVKPNREELAMTVGHDLETEEQTLAAMRTLCERGAQWVLVSDGDRPLLACSLDRVWRFDPLPQPVVNPIGCGDCLTAGIAFGIAQGYDLEHAIRIGIAAASVNLEMLLPARLDRRVVLDRAQTVNVQRIDR